MNKNNENKLVPKLRFPEFINDEGWEETTLGKISDITNGKSNAQDHIENGKYPLFDRSAVIKASNNFLFDCEAVIIPGEGMRFIPKYYNGKFDLHQRAYVLKDFSIDGMFGYYSMSHRSDLLALKAVKSTVLSLRLPILQNFPIQIPKSRNEQQKIAACLSSLDEVITAESQKLEVLKDHKKGLLQNLLPQAGETVPKFRFKQFEDSGEWVFDTFSEYIKLYRGSSPRPIQNYFTTDDTGVNWIKIGDTKNADNFIIKQVEERITLEGAEKSRKVNVGELILANSMSFGKTYQLAIEGYIYDGWFVLREYEQYFDKQFLLQLLNSDYMQTQYKKLSAGGIVQNISSDIVYKTILPHTSIDEQKQIAASLTSLDEFISAQSKKVEALQLHKKGLLQGLFPNVNEVTE